MPTPSAVELPDDEDGLASLAADADQPEVLRREAFARLGPAIEWVSRRLAMRFSGQRRVDIVADALGDIWEVITRFPQGGKFEAWCYTVLKHYWLESVGRDERRRARELRSGEFTLKDGDLRSAVESSLDASDTFGSADLARIGEWPHRDRLILLSLAGLWRKVPTAAWGRWISEHRDRFGVPEDERFPPDTLTDCDQLVARNEVIAFALNLKRNTLSVVLHRGKFRLGDLQYVKDRLDILAGAKQ